MFEKLYLFVVTALFTAALLTACGKKDALSEIQKADRATVSFNIADSGYDFEGEDVQSILSWIKPETWEKTTFKLELSANEHILFYKGNTKYIVGILDAENDEVVFKVSSEMNGSGYYKTDDVRYKELMDALKEIATE